MQRQGTAWYVNQSASIPSTNGFILPSSAMQRSFFNKNRSKKSEDGAAETGEQGAAETDDTEKAAEEKKEPSASADDDKEAAAKEEEDAAQSASSDEELTSEDVKKIRELIKE